MTRVRWVAVPAFMALASACQVAAQCPNGTPPPCGPRRPPLVGDGELRVLSALPSPSTDLSLTALETGLPVRVLVEYSVRQLPPNLRARLVLWALTAAQPGQSHSGWTILAQQSASRETTQLAIDCRIDTHHVIAGHVTLRVALMFVDSTRGTIAFVTSYPSGASSTSTVISYRVAGTLTRPPS